MACSSAHSLNNKPCQSQTSYSGGISSEVVNGVRSQAIYLITPCDSLMPAGALRSFPVFPDNAGLSGASVRGAASKRGGAGSTGGGLDLSPAGAEAAAEGGSAAAAAAEVDDDIQVAPGK
jgi:hypothetical protein